MSDPKRCRARRSNGEPCKRPPIRGGTVCASHGGRAPAVRAAADRRLAQQEATREVERLTDGRAPLTIADVYREMLNTAGLAVAWRDVLERRVLTLDEYGDDDKIRGDVQLFERAMDRAAKVLELIARLDLDTRMTSLTERDAAALVSVAREAMAAADLTPAQAQRFDAAMADGLRRLSQRGSAS